VVDRYPISEVAEEAPYEYHSPRSLDYAFDRSIAHMALQRELGLLSQRRTRFASAYLSDNGFNGTSFKSVGLAH
jgi:hypothetical protein